MAGILLTHVLCCIDKGGDDLISTDKKIEKLQKKSEQIENDIRDKTAEKKKMDTQIKLMSYELLKAEIGNHSMTSDDYVQYARLIKKMENNSVTFADIDSMLDNLSKNNDIKENYNEKKIF